MNVGNEGRIPGRVLHLLAGLQAGVLGGIAMAACIGALAAVGQRSVWAAPNLLASAFYGRSALQRDFGWPTVSGLALHLFVSGLVGMAFGMLVGDTRSRFRVVLLAILAGLVWYYFSQGFFWNRLGVLASLYSAPKTLLLGHLVYGAVLAWYPVALASLRRHLLRERPEAAPRPAGTFSGPPE